MMFDAPTLYHENTYMSTFNAFTSTGRCGAYATPSTQSIAPGTSCTLSAMARMSCSVPRMFDTWVHATRRVRGDRSGARDAASSFGLVSSPPGRGAHHLRMSPRRAARATQAEMLASWSSFETTSSSPGEKGRASERFRRSCVVEGPRTVAKAASMASNR